MDNHQKSVNAQLRKFFNKSISPNHSFIDGDEEVVNQLNRVLTKTQSYIAGGFIVKSLTNYYSFRHVKQDIDIYVNQKNVAELLRFFVENGLFYVSSNNVAPVYDQSFFRKNHISTRFFLSSFDNYKYNYTIDVMVIPDEFDIKSVITNFDLTFCEVWWDGKEVGGTNIDDTINKTGILRKDYEKALIEDGNMFILNRISKYNKRGFTIKYSNNAKVSKNQSINYGKKLKSIEKPEEWVIRNMYIAMQQLFNYNVFRVNTEDIINILYDNSLWYIDNVLNEYTMDEIVRLADKNNIFDKCVTNFNNQFRAEDYAAEIGEKLVLTDLQKFQLSLIYGYSSDLWWVTLNNEELPSKSINWRKHVAKFIGISEIELTEIYDFTEADFSLKAPIVFKKEHNFNRNYVEKIKMKKFYKIEPASLNLFSRDAEENEKIDETCIKISDDEFITIDIHPEIQEQLTKLTREKNRLASQYSVEDKEFKRIHNIERLSMYDDLYEPPEPTPSMKKLTGQISKITKEIMKFKQNNKEKLNEIRKMENELKNPLISKYLEDSKNFVMVIPGDPEAYLDDEILCYDLEILNEKAKNFGEWMIECIGDKKHLIDLIAERGEYNNFEITKTPENIVQIKDSNTDEIKYQFELDYDSVWGEIQYKFENPDVDLGEKRSYSIIGVGDSDWSRLEMENDSFLIEKRQLRPFDKGFDRKMAFDKVNPVFYCAIPVEGGSNNFIPVSQLRTLIHLIENENLRMCYLTPANDENGVQKSIQHTSNYANAFNVNPDYVSANHCQFGSQIMLYDIEICNSKEFNCHTPDCVKSMNSFISKDLLSKLENSPNSTKLKISNVSVNDSETTFDTVVLIGYSQLILFDSENNEIIQYDTDNNLSLDCCSEPGKINLSLENTTIKASVESSDDLLNLCVLNENNLDNNLLIQTDDMSLVFTKDSMEIIYDNGNENSIEYDNINVYKNENGDVVISAKTTGLFTSTIKIVIKPTDLSENEFALILCKVYRIFLPLEIIIKDDKKIVLDPVSKTLRLYPDFLSNRVSDIEREYSFQDLQGNNPIVSFEKETGLFFENIRSTFEFDDEDDEIISSHDINAIKYMIQIYS